MRRIGTALLGRDLSAERPVVILSGNDIEHALIGLAAMYVGIPYAPISPAYALISTDFGKLKHIFELLTPGLVFTSNGEPFRRALEAVVAADAEIVVAGTRRSRPPVNLVSPHCSRRPKPPLPWLPTRGSDPTASRNSCSPRGRPARPKR